MIPGKQYTPDDVLILLRRYKWLILLPFVFGTLITLSVSAILPDRFRSETLILVVPQRVPESYVQSTVTTRIEDRLQAISQQILSRTRLERIINDLELYKEERATGIMEDIVESMRRQISTQIVRGDAFRVSFAYDNPRTAQRVTERLASLFIEENIRDRQIQAEGTNQFLESQLETARQRLVEHEKKLEDFRKMYGGQLPSQFESNLQVIQTTQLQVQSIVESLNRDRDKKIILERLLADAQAEAPPPVVATTPEAMAGATAAQQLEAARQAFAQLSTRLKPEHPDIKRARKLVADLERKAEAEALSQPMTGGARPRTAAEAQRETRIRDLRLEIETLDRQMSQKVNEERRLREMMGSYQSRIEATPARESELTALMRDYDTLRTMYTSLLNKKENANISANLEERQIGEQFKVLDPANLPVRPFSPNRLMLNAGGAVGSLAIGLAFVALLVFRDQSLRNEDDVLLTTSLPVIAMIPKMSTATERRTQRKRRWVASLVTVGAGLALALSAVILNFNMVDGIRRRLGI